MLGLLPDGHRVFPGRSFSPMTESASREGSGPVWLRKLCGMGDEDVCDGFHWMALARFVCAARGQGCPDRRAALSRFARRASSTARVTPSARPRAARRRCGWVRDPSPEKKGDQVEANRDP